jgi:hypothetical protein
MKASNKKLLIKFRSKEIQFGVTRTTVKAIAKELDVNETQVIHMALSKFATDVLTAKQVLALRKDAAKHLPKGKPLSRETLFA